MRVRLFSLAGLPLVSCLIAPDFICEDDAQCGTGVCVDGRCETPDSAGSESGGTSDTGPGADCVASVIAGSSHTCVLSPSGAASCFGSNDFGQINEQTDDYFATLTAVPEAIAGADLLVASKATCARSGSDGLICWGDNEGGVIAESGGTKVGPTPAFTSAAVQAAAVGVSSVCVAQDSGVLCRGALASGVPAGRAVQLSVGAEHACAVDDAGAVRCWGSDADGRLGAAPGEAVEVPPVADVAALFAATCARLADGDVRCWGGNDNLLLGPSPADDGPLVPAGLEGVSFTAISGNHRHACALDDQARAWCWGRNVGGQSDPASAEDRVAPTPLTDTLTMVSGRSSVPAFVGVAAGVSHTCLLSEDAELWCFGDGGEGRLGVDLGDCSDGCRGAFNIVEPCPAQ